MRTTIIHGFIVVLSLSLLSSSCTSDDDGSQNNNSGEIQQIENQAESGTWRITSFIDSGQDETNDFNGYNFTFESNGTITATNGNNTESGNWSVTGSNSSSSSSDDIDFNIMFNVPETSEFDDLNDDWDIISHSDNTLRLRDVSGGNGGTDTLTFERN